MAHYKTKSGGGWPAIRYSFKMAAKAGGVSKLYQALRQPNTCKTCAFGMGGVKGGMVNELGQRLQVCKKSFQAQSQDLLPAIPLTFFRQTPIEVFQKMTGRELEALGRLSTPLFLTEGASHFEVLTWFQALDKLLEKWQTATPERTFFYTSGRSSMEAAYLIQLLAREWGTNNINNCSYYCHQASGVGLAQSLGGGTSTVVLEDLRKSDLVVLIGANPASNHPRLMTFLVELRRRGGKVVVINPFKELGLENFNIPSDPASLLFGSRIADLYLQPHCGGDLALLKAAAVRLWREQKTDRSFLQNHTNHLEAFGADLASENPERLIEMSGVSAGEHAIFCDYLANSKHTIFAWAMGVTHQMHGVETVRAIANLALLRGMIGKPGAGLLPIRGHSNVQGVGTVGVVPKLKPAMIDALVRQFNIELPDTPGMDTFSCMQAAHRGEIDFAVMVGGNLYAANPDLTWAAQALNRIDFTAFLSTTLNLGHLHGHGKEMLILPVRARDEEKQTTSQESMFNYVRLSKGGQPAPSKDVPSESEIFVHVARKLLSESAVPWHEMADHAAVRRFIAATVPNLSSISELDQGKEFTIPGRIKHVPEFNTENNKANLAVIKAIDPRAEAGWFNLLTFRSEGQFNTIIYEEEDLYRGVEQRNVIFMNPKDIKAKALKEGHPVWVVSEVGKMRVELVSGPIRRGNVAMYYPEANAIVPGRVDPQSRTPVFKKVSVRVEPITASGG